MERFITRSASKIIPWSFAFQQLPERFILLPKSVDICNFADDATTYICYDTLQNILKALQKNSMLVKVRWFENNYMKLNTDLCHLIISGYKHE